MSERNIVEMVAALRSGNDEAGQATLLLGEIASVEPLTIRTQNIVISRNVYINPAYTLEASGGHEKIENLFSHAPDPAELFSFLKEFHKKYIIAAGDSVIIVRINDSFYIAEKVVRSS